MSLKLNLPSRGDAAVILLRLAIGFAVDALARRVAVKEKSAATPETKTLR